MYNVNMFLCRVTFLNVLLMFEIQIFDLMLLTRLVGNVLTVILMINKVFFIIAGDSQSCLSPEMIHGFVYCARLVFGKKS